MSLHPRHSTRTLKIKANSSLWISLITSIGKKERKENSIYLGCKKQKQKLKSKQWFSVGGGAFVTGDGFSMAETFQVNAGTSHFQNSYDAAMSSSEFLPTDVWCPRCPLSAPRFKRHLRREPETGKKMLVLNTSCFMTSNAWPANSTWTNPRLCRS